MHKKAGEKALAEGIKAIKNATDRAGVLYYENTPFKTEDVRTIIDRSLLSSGVRHRIL